MRRRWARRPLMVAGILVGLLAGGCAPAGLDAPGSTPLSTGGSNGPAGATASDPNAGAFPSVPPLPTTEDATYLAAAQAELELRNRLREDARVADVIGPDGPSVLAAIAELETAFGERALAEFVAEMGLDLSATTDADSRVASVVAIPPRPRLVANEWSGSLFGATSFMISTWMGFAPEFLRDAGDDEFRQETQEKSEPHDSTIGELKEQLVLTQKLTLGRGRGKIVFDVVLTSAAVLTNVASGEEVARRTSSGNGHFEVNACPDANGVGDGRYRLVNQELITRPDGTSNGGASTTEATFRLINGDDAHLVQTEVQAALTTGVHGTTAAADGTPGAPLDWNAGATYTVVIPASGSAKVGDVQNANSNNATPANQSSLTWLLVMADHYLAEAARKAEAFWRKGECIEMKTSEESKQVAPGATLTVTVDPTHKFDNAPVKAPVTAAFSGKERLEPADRPQDPPASMTFTASPEEGDKGTIELKQVGKRGIGKKTLEFSVGVADYRIGSSTTATFGGLSGTKCGGKEGPWSVDLRGPELQGVITFAIPPNGTAAEAHGVFDVTSFGGTVHWDVSGPVSFVEGEPAMLKFGTLEGEVTARALGRSITTRNKVPPFSVLLEAGRFCT